MEKTAFVSRSKQFADAPGKATCASVLCCLIFFVSAKVCESTISSSLMPKRSFASFCKPSGFRKVYLVEFFSWQVEKLGDKNP